MCRGLLKISMNFYKQFLGQEVECQAVIIIGPTKDFQCRRQFFQNIFFLFKTSLFFGTNLKLKHLELKFIKSFY